jgi:hypothetical protein
VTNPSLGVLNINTNGRALRNQGIDNTQRTLVIISAGQSNMTNVAPSSFTPVNASAIDNFNVNDGAIYAAVDPLVGCSNVATPFLGNPMLRVADTLITNGKFDRVILTPVSIDGTTVSQWETTFSNRITVAIQRLAAKGIKESPYVTIVILWGQGESDHGTSQSAYQNSLSNVIAATRAVGFSGKWFVAKQTYTGTVDANIQAAQAGVVNPSNNVWAGPNADLLIGTVCNSTACRQGDNVHFSNAGSASYAQAWVDALAASGNPF